VTGHVIFADTQRPARFAEVILLSVPDKATLEADENNEILKHPMNAVALSGHSALDGSFTVAEVPPGDWYAVAMMPGYVLPIAKVRDDDEDYNDATLMREFPIVHVETNRSSGLDLTLRRGGAIAGRLQYEDGSPVVGMTVRVEPLEGQDGLGALHLRYLTTALYRHIADEAQTEDGGDRQRSRSGRGRPAARSCEAARSQQGCESVKELGMRVGVSVCLALLIGVAAAQKAPAPTGTVTGHVICADTQLPARFAEVSLIRKPSPAEIEKMFGPRGDDAESWLGLKVTKTGGTFDLLTDTAGPDGIYTVQRVPPGDYWVIAKVAGYVIPVDDQDVLDDKQARDLARRMAAVPLVHVAAEHTASADISLNRGGVLAGRVQFEDGSPVAGVGLYLGPEKWPADFHAEGRSGYAALESELGYGNRQGFTDDEGRFRIAGLRPGRYTLLAHINTKHGSRGNGMFAAINSEEYESLKLFVPGAFYRSGAKVFEIRGDETIRDADMTVDLSKLHTVRGRVLAKEDQHAPTAAEVDAISDIIGDTGKGREANGVYHPDGTFEVDYLPPGNFTISIHDVADKESVEGAFRQFKTLKTYEDAKVTVTIGEHDVTLDDILVVEAKHAAEKMDAAE